MADDLHRPLGITPVRRVRGGWVVVLACVAGAAVLVGAAAFRLWPATNPGVPSGAVVATITAAPPPPPVVAPPPPPEPKPASDPNDGVLRPPGQPVTAGVFIKVPQGPTVALSPAPDPALVEKSRFGPLPRLGPGGARPMDVYARPPGLEPGLPANAPRLALIVGGMGVDPAFTGNAIVALPPAVTLGFAPTGDKLERRVADARAAGHEVVLMLSAGGPGRASPAAPARGLTADLAPADALDRLHWQMARFAGYVGAATAGEVPALARESVARPLLADVAGRGLIFVDGGASNRSVAPSLAGSLGLPLVRATAISSGTAGTGLDTALDQLAQKARERGVAVGMVSGSADTIGRIALFTQKLAERGVALVPVSAVMALQLGQPDKAARQ